MLDVMSHSWYHCVTDSYIERALANSDRGASDAFEPVRGFLSYCFSLILSLCSPLAAEVGLQHCGHREGKDQTDSV